MDPNVTQPGRETSRVASPEEGRWIRPVEAASVREEHLETGSVNAVAASLLRETRKRVSSLAALERALEEKIQRRWQELEEALEERSKGAESEIEEMRVAAEREAEELRAVAQRDGRREGFAKGEAEGREQGYAAGLNDGVEAGRAEGAALGHREATERVQDELGGAAAALASALSGLENDRARLLERCRKDVARLSVEVAKRLVKREIDRIDDVVLRNVQQAVELVFRRGQLAIHVHPKDRGAVEDALGNEPRWADGFEAIEVRDAADVERGGCRLVSGAGTVDMTLGTQIRRIEEALGLEPSSEAERSEQRSPDRSVEGQGPSTSEHDGGSSADV